MTNGADPAESVDPVFAPWDGKRVPVTLLGGWLGSGKTTVLNELLARTDQPIAVLVNDVGEVNIDASLIAQHHGDTIELTDGCVCCSLINGFVEAFDTLRQRPEPPAHVVVELSGVAQPNQAAPWANTIGFQLDGIVVLVDAEQCDAQLSDPWLAARVRDQIGAADLLVISKNDLASPEQKAATLRHLREIAPDTPAVESSHPATSAALLDLATRRPDGVDHLPAPTLFDEYSVSTVAVPAGVEEDVLTALLDNLPADTYRAKGVFDLADGRRVLVQRVGPRTEITTLPMAEDQSPTSLVVIGPQPIPRNLSLFG